MFRDDNGSDGIQFRAFTAVGCPEYMQCKDNARQAGHDGAIVGIMRLVQGRRKTALKSPPPACRE
jgi:hypothetical protein